MCSFVGKWLKKNDTILSKQAGLVWKRTAKTGFHMGHYRFTLDYSRGQEFWDQSILPRMICLNFQIPTCSVQLHSFEKQAAQCPLRIPVAMRCSVHLKIAEQCKSVSKDKSSCDGSWDGGKIPAIEPSASAASCLTIGCSFTSLSILLRVSKAALFCNCPKT